MLGFNVRQMLTESAQQRYLEIMQHSKNGIGSES